MSEGNEQWAVALAAMDQFRSATKEIGAVVAAYFNSLCEQGLSPDAALMLTAGFQASILQLMFMGTAAQEQPEQ